VRDEPGHSEIQVEVVNRLAFLVSLYCKLTRDDAARTLITVEHRELNVYQHEIGKLGFGFGDALGAS
jgi:hypothetical protein